MNEGVVEDDYLSFLPVQPGAADLDPGRVGGDGNVDAEVHAQQSLVRSAMRRQVLAGSRTSPSASRERRAELAEAAASAELGARSRRSGRPAGR